MKQKAKDYFLGKPKKLNCAQSVSQAYRDVYEFQHPNLETHGSCGGGRAPKGYCGALHAAIDIMNLTGKGGENECENFFLKEFGALTCKELKEKKISCVRCVEAAAEFLTQRREG